MFNSNNQIIIEELYDDTIQPTEEDIVEYAEYIGIDTEQEPELMWIARQGVKAPLPKGWKAVHDPTQNELYYFNFETGESIWDHPCDKDYKNLVVEERKIFVELGRDNYKPSNKLVNSLKNSDKLLSGTTKSTSTISDLIQNGVKNNKQYSKLRSGLFDSKDLINVEFEEEEEDENIEKENKNDLDLDDSWSKKSGSDDSDDFRKPVDFGIDKETSMKLDKLNLMLIMGKEATQNQTQIQIQNQAQVTFESAPTTSRDVLDSPTRNYVKTVLGLHKEEKDLDESKKVLDSITEDKTKEFNETIDKEKELKILKESLDREFDQRRLELLENKENRIKKLKDEIEFDLKRMSDIESRRFQKEKEDRLRELKNKMEEDYLKEKDLINKKHLDDLNNLQKDFDNEKQIRKQKFSMQLSKFMKSGKSFDELDENDEKREIEIYFDHIEKKYADKLEDRKREIELKYEKKLKEMEDELRRLHEIEADKKDNEIRLLKEKNLKIENYEKQMEKLLSERVKEFKQREQNEIDRIKEEYEIKVKTFKEKYKQLEENEFNFLESEFNKVKDSLHSDYNTKISNLENKYRIDLQNIQRQEEDIKKRNEIIQDKRRQFEQEWLRLNQEEKSIQEKKSKLIQSQAEQNTNMSNLETDDLKLKYEIEKLKLEKIDLEKKLDSMKILLDKFYTNPANMNNNQLIDKLEHEESITNDSEKIVAKINDINNKLNNEYQSDYEDEDNTTEQPTDLNDDNEMKSLVKHAKLKLKLKYYNSKKHAQIDLSNKSAGFSNETDSVTSSDTDDLYLNTEIEVKKQDINLNESKKYLLDSLNKEKDALQIANEILNRYKQNLFKKKLRLDSAQADIKTDESLLSKYKTSNEKLKHKTQLEEKRLLLEKEALDLEQLSLNIRTGKRLIKQKKFHLNHIENQLVNNKLIDNDLLDEISSSSSDDSYDVDQYSTDPIDQIDLNDLITFKNNSNLNDFLNKIKLAHAKGDLKEIDVKKIEQTVKKIPKLNSRLDLTFENMKSNGSDLIDKITSINEPNNSIEKKWKKYLDLSSNEKKNFFKNLIEESNNSKINSSAIQLSYMSNNRNRSKNQWENSIAYQKLMLESGTRMLDDKWNQYIGFDTISLNNFGSTLKNINLKKLNDSYQSNNSNSNTNLNLNQFLSTSQLTLPLSTQNRLNQHREWIKQFKASGTQL